MIPWAFSLVTVDLHAFLRLNGSPQVACFKDLGKVFVAEPLQQNRDSVGPDLPDGHFGSLFRFCFRPRLASRAPLALLQPDAQPRPLIYRLPQAQHLPPNHASQNPQHDGQRDVDPISHGGSMPSWRQKSRTLRYRPARLTVRCLQLKVLPPGWVLPPARRQDRAATAALDQRRGYKPDAGWR